MDARHWTRFGQDRLYVNIDDETTIGYWDQRTDQLHPAPPPHAEALAAVIAECKLQHGLTSTSDHEPANPVTA